MRGPSVVAGGLTPVSRAEAVALSDGLRRHAERKPLAAEDPVMVLLARLLISLPEDEDALVTADRRREILVLEEENTSLRAEVADRTARVRVANLACEELQQKLEAVVIHANQPVADSQEVEALKSQIVIGETRIGEAETALELLKAEAIRVAEEDAKEEAASAALIADLEERLEKVIAKKDQANGYLDDLRGRVRLLKDIVGKQEWSAKHKRHRSRDGKAHACPLCGGLSTEYDHNDAGHKKGCLMATLTASLSK